MTLSGCDDSATGESSNGNVAGMFGGAPSGGVGGAGGAAPSGGQGGVGGASGVNGGAAGVAGVGVSAGTGGAGGTGGMVAAGMGGTGGSAAGTGGVGGGAAGMGGAGGGTAADPMCVAEVMSGGRAQACAECICGLCGAQLAACTMNTDPAPSPFVMMTSGEICEAVVKCSSAAGCSGGFCYCGAEVCDATNYMNPGPCKEEINNGAFLPPPAESDQAPGTPLGNANAVGECVDTMCATACE